MEIAISYGTYYSYLRPKRGSNVMYNIEAQVKKFNDGEIAVEFPDSIRGKRVFIFGDTVENSTELFMTIDAARRSSAGEINIVLPYYGYCRADKRGVGRASVGAAVMANILQNLGANRVLVIDLHSDQIQCAFQQIPVEHLSGRHLFADTLTEMLSSIEGPVKLASPDAGGTTRVEKFAKKHNLTYVTMSKHREEAGVVESMILLGDVEGCTVILIDDIVDTGGTLIKAVQKLKDSGAKEVYVVITHPILSNKATEKLQAAGIKLITANTRKTVVNNKNKDFQIIDCSEMIMNAIIMVSNDKSVSSLL